MWEYIDKIMMHPDYDKSFNKVINSALLFGLPELYKRLFDTVEIDGEEKAVSVPNEYNENAFYFQLVIIDRETFKQVQAEMAKRRSRPRVSDKTITEKGKFSGKYPFSDLLVCDICGNRYRRCMWISGGKKKTVWRCITRIEHGGKVCKSISVEDKLIRGTVYKAIGNYIRNNNGAIKVIESELSKQFSVKDFTEDLSIIERNIKELDRQMEERTMIGVTSNENGEKTRDEIIELSQKIVALRDKRSILEEKLITEKTKNDELSRFVEELSRYDTDFSEITDNKLKRIIHKIRIKQDYTISIELKDGTQITESLK